jgi:hypothetical protein
MCTHNPGEGRLAAPASGNQGMCAGALPATLLPCSVLAVAADKWVLHTASAVQAATAQQPCLWQVHGHGGWQSAAPWVALCAKHCRQYVCGGCFDCLVLCVRNQGVGSALLQAATSRTAGDIYLTTLQPTAPFYARAGFQVLPLTQIPG